MAKYMKPVDLWAEGVQAAIVAGKLKLQCGQWVMCGSGKLSRFVEVSKSGTFNVVHWSPHQTSNFHGRVLSLQLARTRTRLTRLERDTQVYLYEEEAASHK